MILAPVAVGNQRLNDKILAEDKKHCRKIGPCGMGEKAVYLNSFFLDRRYYAVWSDVRRVFKRIAMSRGGFSGKGIFGSIPYLVVQLSSGRELSCNFKYEDEVDEFLRAVQSAHPEIPIHSQEAEHRLAAARAREEARYVKQLSDTARASLTTLREARSYLEACPEIGEDLSRTARNKRSVDGVKTSNLLMAWGILLVSVLLTVIGVASLIAGKSSWPLYFVLFGFAGIFFISGAGIIPTGRRSRKAVQADWDKAVAKAEAYIAEVPSFPVPPQYAHPAVLDRMIRVIREGKAETVDKAFMLMKEELKGLDHTKTVSQEEYDEIVLVKPMFRVMNYQ